jgi:hypothetical protein
MRHGLFAAALAMASLSLTPAPLDPAAEKYWPQWRGPYASGVSKTADPPVEWSETKNVRWKIEIGAGEIAFRAGEADRSQALNSSSTDK